MLSLNVGFFAGEALIETVCYICDYTYSNNKDIDLATTELPIFSLNEEIANQI